MALLVKPNQSTAIGTQDTDGSDCSPVSNGPTEERSQLNRNSATPISEPSTIDAAKPINPRLTLVQMTVRAEPSAIIPVNCVHTLAGEGRMYSGFQCRA